MSSMETLSLVAAIASVILAIGAIWLSLTFFRMSSEASRETTEAAKGIGSSVERLEKLFDKLYSDTFSMMRDTVSDMRRHIWPTDESDGEQTLEEMEQRADEKIAVLKDTMETQVAELLKNQKLADGKVASLRSEMKHLIERGIEASRQIDTEAREETVRQHIVREIRTLLRRGHRRYVVLFELIDRLRDRFSVSRVFSELERMVGEDLLSVTGDLNDPEAKIRLTPAGAGLARSA